MEIEEARERLLGKVNPVSDTEICGLTESLGRVCAEDIYSPCDVPGFPRSAMDGYAVNSRDIKDASAETPAVLKVLGEIDAGDDLHFTNEKNSAVRIMTGGMIPEGFDCVVKQEDTDYGEDEVKVYKSLGAYMNYCKAAENFAKGTLLCPAGMLINRGIIGILASCGISTVTVLRRLRVAIISTGSELREPSEPLAPAKIYSSIGPMLASSVNNIGAEVVLSMICPDDEEMITKALSRAFEISDIIITTGGVSVGKRDLLPRVIKKLGGEVLFDHVNIQPGTPTMGSMIIGKPVLSLSGNPYAALVNFDLYFYALAARLSGCADLNLTESEAVLADDYPKAGPARRFLRGRESFGAVKLFANNKSSVISNLAESNCYVDIPAGTVLKAGDKVHIVRIKM